MAKHLSAHRKQQYFKLSSQIVQLDDVQLQSLSGEMSQEQGGEPRKRLLSDSSECLSHEATATA